MTYNARGQLTRYDVDVQNDWSFFQGFDSYGYPSFTEIGSQYYDRVSLRYSIDPVTLNLTNRQKWTNNGTTLQFNEDFTFDALDRLTQWQVSDADGASQVYDVNFSNSGNITYKSDMGLYAYRADKPNAVEYLLNLEGPAHTVALNSVDYNLFNKTSNLNVEKGGKVLFDYTLEYGADDQRRKGTFVKGDGSPVTTIYAGLFEERSDGHRLYHIKTPAGISALIVTNKNDPRQRDIYYLYNDYQGSLIAAQLQGSSDLLEEFSYDPWGRRRNGDNWLSYHIPDTSFSRFYKRGYTGHVQ